MQHVEMRKAISVLKVKNRNLSFLGSQSYAVVFSLVLSK